MTKNGADVLPTRPQRRRRPRVLCRVVLCLVLMAVAATACSGDTVPRTTERVMSVDGNGNGDTTAMATAEPAPEPPGEPTPAVVPTAVPAIAAEPKPTPTPHPIALADTELPRAPIGFDSLFDTAPSGRQPVSIAIENINVSDAAIIPVGVNPDDLSFEVPPADQVGWYEFGPTPGEAGSAVLAAHIAFNGVDGVFRYLENVEIGAVVVIGFDDETDQRYRIDEVTEYVKEALPESLWARDGKEQLALITCGGAFNYQRNSYESNTVAIAVPI